MRTKSLRCNLSFSPNLSLGLYTSEKVFRNFWKILKKSFLAYLGPRVNSGEKEKFHFRDYVLMGNPNVPVYGLMEYRNQSESM